MPRRTRAAKLALVAAFAFGWSALPAHAQNSRDQNSYPSSEPASELARENLKHVAASATEIESILHKDPGLVVELKSWIAKRATEQGQIVTDDDLTDQAIFERLRNDIEFRAVATRLVQRYGYLTPQLNPMSQEGKEQQLVSEERAKWIAMEQEQEMESAHALNVQQACQMQQTANCASRPSAPAVRPDIGNTSGGGSTQPPSVPNSPSTLPFNANPNSSPFPTQRPSSGSLQIYQASASQSDLLSQMPMASGDSLESLGALSQANAAGGMSSPHYGAANSSMIGADPLSAGQLAPPSMMGSQLPSDYASASDSNSGTPSPNSAEAALRALSKANGTDRGEDLDRASLVRGNNPYVNVPSLYDMYMQAAPWTQQPRRFGIDVF